MSPLDLPLPLGSDVLQVLGKNFRFSGGGRDLLKDRVYIREVLSFLLRCLFLNPRN